MYVSILRPFIVVLKNLIQIESEMSLCDDGGELQVDVHIL